MVDGRIDQPAPDVCLPENGVSADRFDQRDRSLTVRKEGWRRAFRVRGIFWRHFVDWAATHLPRWLQEPLLWLGTVVFFFVAAPARRAIVDHLALIHPRSVRIPNYLRTLAVFANFGRCLVDSALFRWKHTSFECDLAGERFLQQLATAPNGIVLTAHIGSYDLGAALFTEKFHRVMHMVRAPEPDPLARQHLRSTLQQAAAGAVTVDYNDSGSSLAFDLLDALRGGTIICIQGDRVTPEIARRPAKFFGRDVLLPFGPFVLSWAAETPIYPLFIVRTGNRRYQIIAHEPIVCQRIPGGRDEQLADALQKWADILEATVRENWAQWFAFTPPQYPTGD